MNIFFLFSLLISIAFSLSIPLKQINSSPLEKFSYFKSLQMRVFLGSGIEYPLSNFMDSQYYFTVEIGDPGQIFEVIPDISSDSIWIPSYSCWSLTCFLHKTYISGSSSTHSLLGDKFSTIYGAGKVQGYLSTDYVTIDNYDIKLVFGEATSFEGASWMAVRFDGVFGLPSLLNQLKKQSIIKNQIFSLQHYQDDIEIAFEKCLDGYIFVDIIEKEFWKINLEEIKIKDEVIGENLKAIFDIQTPFIIVDTKIFNKINQLIKISPDCSNLSSLPVLIFKFSDVVIKITPEMYIIQSGNEINECLLGISYIDFPISFQNTIIIGGFARHSYNMCFDIENSRIGFNFF